MARGAKILAFAAVLCLTLWVVVLAFDAQPLRETYGLRVIYGEGEDFFADAVVYRGFAFGSGLDDVSGGQTCSLFTVFALPFATMSQATELLKAIDAGDPQAADELLPRVYEELRKLAGVRMAQEKPGQTLQATALVHEAWLRLVGPEKPSVWNSRGHFFAAAAEAMRRILVDRARQKARLRHGARAPAGGSGACHDCHGG